MNWLIQEISKSPKLKKWAVFIIYTIYKSYMYLLNKFCEIKDNKVIFISFWGKSYSDNPKAISQKLHELHPEFDIVWLFNNPEEKRKVVPNYVRCVKRISLKALKELATAKFWIDNFPKPLYICKNKKQVYIQTWHGDRGFKRILYDCRTLMTNGHYKEGDLLEEKECDLMISGSEYGDMQYKSAFKYRGEILQKGCPRNDILVHSGKALISDVKRSIGIRDATYVILYAPTLREDALVKDSNQELVNIDLNEVLGVLENKTNQEWICLVRAHSSVKGLSGIPKNEKFIDVSSYEDMSELLLISDMLITDYSSSAGDFALLGRPIVLFQSDRKEYIEKDRTFYFDIDESPFMVAMSQSELIQIIKEIDIDTARKNCKDILDFYKTNETGKSSEAIVNYIISKAGK